MKCRHCGSMANLQKEVTKKLADGSLKVYYSCRSCSTARHKKYRKTVSGHTAQQRANRRYEARNPARRKAWSAVQRAKLPTGDCVECGSSDAHRHHPNPLNKLLIVYLCPAHHKAAHSTLN